MSQSWGLCDDIRVKGTCKVLVAFWILSEILHLDFVSNKIVCVEGLLTLKPSAVYSRVLETDFGTSYWRYGTSVLELIATSSNHFLRSNKWEYWKIRKYTAIEFSSQIFGHVFVRCLGAKIWLINIFNFLMEKFSGKLFHTIEQDLVKLLDICM